MDDDATDETAVRESEDLLDAAGSGLAFWDNPEDDEDWNEA